jgi:hypothetical protein
VRRELLVMHNMTRGFRRVEIRRIVVFGRARRYCSSSPAAVTIPSEPAAWLRSILRTIAPSTLKHVTRNGLERLRITSLSLCSASTTTYWGGCA